MRKWVRLCLVAGWCAVAGWAVDWKALRLQGHVSDFAGVIDPGSKSQLEEYCARARQTSGTDIQLVVLPSLEREPIAAVAKAIFDGWAPSSGKDTRLMLLLSVSDRRAYVAVGGGLEARAASGLQGSVLREISPALRVGDYNEALRAAAATAAEASLAGAHGRGPALPRRLHWRTVDAIPGVALAGGLATLALLAWAGTPRGYAAGGGRAWLPPALGGRGAMCRSTWGSRGSGGFGGYDSGDSFGGFGGGSSSDW